MNSCAAVIWLTGLSGAGKSTIAQGVRRQLDALGLRTSLVDGDLIRHTICRDLGFSDDDRRENIRRAGGLAIKEAKQGAVVLVALISPFADARASVRGKCAAAGVPFKLVFVDCPIWQCETRDPKGLYRLARAGSLPCFTGISSPYEPPVDANLVVCTDREAESKSIGQVVGLVLETVTLDSSVS